MTIDELNALETLTAGDEFPVWDSEESGEPTKKITAQNMANSVKTLGSLVNTTEMNTAIAQSTADVIRTGDVVDNLTSTATDKPLSAAQGKALNEAIAQSTADISEWTTLATAFSSRITNTSGTEAVVNTKLRLVSLSVHATVGTAIEAGGALVSVDARYVPKQTLVTMMWNGNNSTTIPIRADVDGTIRAISNVVAPINVYFNMMWKY